MQFEWINQFITVFLGSGAALAVGKIFLEVKRERTQRYQTKQYLALQIAFRLEGFAIELANMIEDHNNYFDSGNVVGKEIVDLPVFQMPENESLKLFESEIVAELLEFPQRCEMARVAGRFANEVGRDEDSIFESAVELGVHAIEIAKNVRSSAELASRNLQFKLWNVDRKLREELKQVDLRRLQREKEREEFLARMEERQKKT